VSGALSLGATALGSLEALGKPAGLVRKIKRDVDHLVGAGDGDGYRTAAGAQRKRSGAGFDDDDDDNDDSDNDYICGSDSDEEDRGILSGGAQLGMMR